jgi:hypothetical protein
MKIIDKELEFKDGDYEITYENIYEYNNYNETLIILFILLFSIYLFAVYNKLN